MARYYNAETLRDFVKQYTPHINGSTTIECVETAILNAPTADVEEVVRCKDCGVPHNKWLGCPHLNGLIPSPDFYCAKGIPKERGGENDR